MSPEDFLKGAKKKEPLVNKVSIEGTEYVPKKPIDYHKGKTIPLTQEEIPITHTETKQEYQSPIEKRVSELISQSDASTIKIIRAYVDALQVRKDTDDFPSNIKMSIFPFILEQKQNFDLIKDKISKFVKAKADEEIAKIKEEKNPFSTLEKENAEHFHSTEKKEFPEAGHYELDKEGNFGIHTKNDENK